MANGSSAANSTVTVSLNVKSPLPAGVCIDQTLLKQIVSALEAKVSVITDTSVIYSPTAPADKTKIWQQIDPVTGIPIGPARRWDPTSNSWISGTGDSGSDPDSETVCISEDPDNLITEDASGCLKVSSSDVPCRSTDTDNLINLDAAGCWKVARSSIKEADISEDSCNDLIEGSDSDLFVPKRGMYIPPAPTTITNSYTVGSTNYSLDTLGAALPDWDPSNPTDTCVSHLYFSWTSWYDGGTQNGSAATPILRIGVNSRTIITHVNIGNDSGNTTWFTVAVQPANPDQVTVSMESSYGSPDEFFDGTRGNGVLKLEGYIYNGGLL